MKNFTYRLLIFLLLGISIFGGYSLYLTWEERNIPPLPPINVDLPTTDPVDPDPIIPQKPDCSLYRTLDERISCEIQNYGDDESRIVHFKPAKQPDIYGTREQNNLIIQSHIEKTSHQFFIAGQNSYIVVVTKRAVAQNRSIFLGVLGRSQGAIYKNNNYNFVSDISENKKDGFYVFRATSIETMGYGPQTDSFNLLQYRDVSNLVPFSFSVGEPGNYVTDIYVVNI